MRRTSRERPRMTASQAPSGSLPFDPSVAHQARMYDYLLGGCFL
jgi:hypothetical protein